MVLTPVMVLARALVLPVLCVTRIMVLPVLWCYPCYDVTSIMVLALVMVLTHVMALTRVTMLTCIMVFSQHNNTSKHSLLVLCC